MPLSPEEQKELNALEAEFAPSSPVQSGLTPEEEEELRSLETELSPTTQALTPAEEVELAQLEKEVGAEKETSFLGDVGEGIKGGLKSALAPFSLTKEDYEGDKSWTETIASTATDVTTGIVVTAASIAGLTAVGVAAAPAAIIAAGAYGIYSGLGLESSRSEAEGKDFSIARAGVRVALEINPLISKGGKLLKAARTAAQMTGEGGLEYSHSGDVTTAVAAGVLGGVAIALSPLTKVQSTEALGGISPVTLDGITEMLADESTGILANTYKKFDDIADKALPSEIPDEFKRFMVKGKVKKLDSAYDKITSSLGQERLQSAYEDFLLTKAQREATKEYLLEAQKGLGVEVTDSIVAFLSAAEDPKFIARRSDKMLGLAIEEKVLNAASEAEHAFIQTSAPYVRKARKLAAEAKKNKISLEEVGRVMGGHAKAESEAVQSMANRWAELYEEVRQELVGRGYNVARRENYINMTALDAPDMYNAMRTKITKFKKIGAKLGVDPLSLTDEQIAKNAGKFNVELLQNELQDLKKISANLLKLENPMDVSSITQFNKALEQVLDPTRKLSVGFDVGARFQRKGEIPEAFRTFDVGQNFMNYIGANLKAPFYTDVFNELDRTVYTLKSLGLEKSAAYWNKYSQHLSGMDAGIQMGFAKKYNKIKADWRLTQFDDNASSFAKRSAKQKENAIDFMAWMTSLVYPNFLGFNARAALRNYTQTLALTAPSLKGSFGYEIVASGWKQMVKNLGDLENQMNKLGITSHGEILREGYKELSNSIKLGPYRKFVESLGDASMYAYTKSDTVNRYITYHAGQSWAKKLANGDKRAVEALKELSPATRQKLRRTNWKTLLENKDTDALGDILGRALISDTQFHYGKTQMHQFGRDAGKMFSMFTKWPTMVGSEMAYNVWDKGAYKGTMKNLRKYGTPLALLHVAQVIRENVEDSDTAPISNYLVGKDLRTIAPALSMANVDLFGGPIQRLVLGGVQKGSKALKEVGSGEFEKGFDTVWGEAKNSLRGFSPLPLQPVMNELDRMEKAGIPVFKEMEDVLK